MKEVFLVTDGDYSDYHIAACFSTRELAEAYIKQRGGNVEVWGVDTTLNEVKRQVYVADLDTTTGTLLHTWEFSEYAQPDARIPTGEARSGKNRCIAYSFVSVAHAEKLAVELRQAYLRENV